MSILSIFCLVRSYLRAIYPNENEWTVTDRPGIVIIDELDAHLHPVWQQRMAALLREIFPQVQFIVSAHSPLIAAGCLEHEVAVLRKSPSGRFFLEQFERDFVGASAQELYRELFQIHETDETLWRYPSWKPMDERSLDRLRQLDAAARGGRLTAYERLERARLLREARAKELLKSPRLGKRKTFDSGTPI